MGSEAYGRGLGERFRLQTPALVSQCQPATVPQRGQAEAQKPGSDQRPFRAVHGLIRPALTAGKNLTVRQGLH